MRQRAHSLLWFLYWILAVLTALVAVSLLAIKFLIQHAADYRQDIEQILARQLNAEVEIASIEGQWQRWQPQILLQGFKVAGLDSTQGLSLELNRAEFIFDPLASVKTLQPIFSRFDLDGLTVRYALDAADAEEKEQPKAPVSGHPASDAGSGLLAFLLHQSSVSFDDTRIEVLTTQGQTLQVSPLDLRLQHDGVLHQLTVDAELVSSQGKATLGFVAEVEGNPSKDETRFYLNIEGLDQQLLNPWLQLADIELESLQASQKIWGRLDRGKLSFLTGKTEITDFKYQDYDVPQAEVHTALMRRDRSYQLQITDLLLGSNKATFNLPRISLDLVRQGTQIRPLTLMVDRVDLENVVGWIKEQPFLPVQALDALNSLAPTGELENVRVDWAADADLDAFELQADLNQVGIRAWDDVPEIQGINGLLLANRDKGEIHLRSDQFSMHYPTLFDYSWQYSGAEGVIGWRFEDKGVVVASQLLHLNNEYLTAAGRFSIYLPFDRDEQPLLNLQIGMQGGDGLQAKYYIPPKEVGVDTYNWLVAAIQNGHIKRAGFVLNGVTRARLDDYQLPAVQMFFDVEDASFAYQPGWPPISGADVFVFFRNGELLAESVGGKIYDSNIDFAWVHLPQSTDKLLVNGAVSGKVSDLQKLLTESPLKEEVGDDLSSWQMTGQAQTEVAINLPLYTQVLPDVSVHSQVEGGRFYSAEDRIDFTAIKGAVNYHTKRGLSAPKLTAQLFGQPVNAEIKTQNKETQIHISSAVDIAVLRDWLGLELLQVAKGKLAYQARVDLCPGKSCNQLVINTDLQGVEINAPAPLTKTASQKTGLSIISDLGRGQSSGSAVRFNLGNHLRGVMLNRGAEIERARFTLGGERPEVPAQPGIWVDGKLDLLVYEQLERFLTVSGLTKPADAKTASGKPGTGSSLQSIDLEIERFIFDDIELNQLTTQLRPDPQGWLLAVDSPRLNGTLLLPDGSEQPYKAELAYLRVDRGGDEESTDSAAVEETVTPEQIPKLDFEVASLVLDGKPLGRWRFQMRPTENGATVKDIRADMHGADVRGELRWDKGAEELTDLTMKLNSQDFGKVLDALGISDALETKSLDAYLQLTWRGAPWQFDIARTDGEMQFTAKQGRLKDVGNSGNFLRIFGILNLQSLGRRLRLDFTDLTKSGVAFDEMKASYRIQKGIAHTKEPFVMTGPSANMAMQGSLNLVNETVDKDIEVALPVTDNIPLVSVLLGAPQVAGAVFLFDKLIGDPLAKFTTVKYHISGDWGDPQVEIKRNNKTEQPSATGTEANHG